MQFRILNTKLQLREFSLQETEPDDANTFKIDLPHVGDDRDTALASELAKTKASLLKLQATLSATDVAIMTARCKLRLERVGVSAIE
jgi:hypothetical protein